MPDIPEMIALAPADFRTRPLVHNHVTRAQWAVASGDLSRGTLTLLSLWASRSGVHMALMDTATKLIGVLSYESRAKTVPSVSRWHAPAQRLERAMVDLFGLEVSDLPDSRPWLDHGRWNKTHPLGSKAAAAAQAAPYDFLPVVGESLHQVAVGPVHAGIIEPGHFRFTVQGEIVVRLEARLGYTHKGIDGLLKGATVERGAQLAGRTSGDSTVAYAWAYAQAVEAALAVEVPERAIWLRALMAELERVANHVSDVGAVCNDAAFSMMLAQCSILRERVLRVSDACFGHRMMRDKIVPGGVSHDLPDDGARILHDLVTEVRRGFAAIVALYDGNASILDRTVSTGNLSHDLAVRFGAGGYVGRASGRNFDTRRDLAYAPYDQLHFEVPLRHDGDVNARIWQRIDEVGESLSMIDQILDRLPPGPVLVALPVVHETREGLGLVEGFRGDVLVWVSLDAKGRIARCHLRDPSWFQWPLMEAVVEGNIIADFPLCNKSFNCSYSGHDL